MLLCVPRDEAATRIEPIDPVLRSRGWSEDLLRREKTPGGFDIIDEDQSGAADGLTTCCVFPLSGAIPPLPVAVLEAMARGLPCIATPVGGIPDVIVDNVNGVLVAVDDPAALAQALRRILDDPSFARALGDRAKESAAELFSVDAVASELIAVFDLAVAR